MTTTELSVAQAKDLAAIASDYRLDVQRVVNHVLAVRACMEAVMRPGVHYGVIPGTEKKDKAGKDISKPTLFQPGADVLCLLFRLRTRYAHRWTEKEDFLAVRSRCRLIHITSGVEWAEGFGSANSREDRYLNQSTARVCPTCKKATIRKSKPRGNERAEDMGWYCWQKIEGCGAEFPKDHPDLSGTDGVVVGAKVWNLHNTILKISNKRSKVAGALTATGATDIFDQDLDDLMDTAEGLREAVAGGHAGHDPEKGNGKSGSAGNDQPSNGNGSKVLRASPGQIRDLNAALREINVSFDKALAWVNIRRAEKGLKPHDEIMDLGPDEATIYTTTAREIAAGGGQG